MSVLLGLTFQFQIKPDIYTGCTKLNNLSKNVSFSDMKEGELPWESFLTLSHSGIVTENGLMVLIEKRTEGVSKKSLLNARKL